MKTNHCIFSSPTQQWEFYSRGFSWFSFRRGHNFARQDASHKFDFFASGDAHEPQNERKSVLLCDVDIFIIWLAASSMQNSSQSKWELCGAIQHLISAHSNKHAKCVKTMYNTVHTKLYGAESTLKFLGWTFLSRIINSLNFLLSKQHLVNFPWLMYVHFGSTTCNHVNITNFPNGYKLHKYVLPSWDFQGSERPFRSLQTNDFDQSLGCVCVKQTYWKWQHVHVVANMVGVISVHLGYTTDDFEYSVKDLITSYT